MDVDHTVGIRRQNDRTHIVHETGKHHKVDVPAPKKLHHLLRVVVPHDVGRTYSTSMPSSFHTPDHPGLLAVGNHQRHPYLVALAEEPGYVFGIGSAS